MLTKTDEQQGKVERQCRTTVSTVPARVLENRSNYFAFQCAQFYTAEWSTVTYKYSNYGGSYLSLPSRSDRPVVLPDAKHEIDMDGDLDEDFELPDTPPTHEGYLLKVGRQSRRCYSLRTILIQRWFSFRRDPRAPARKCSSTSPPSRSSGASANCARTSPAPTSSTSARRRRSRRPAPPSLSTSAPKSSGSRPSRPGVFSVVCFDFH